jgi:hypothetical protein
MRVNHVHWAKGRDSAAGSTTISVRRADNRLLRTVLGVLVLPLTLLAVLVGGTAPASAAGLASPSVSTTNGFPLWYQDSAGNRVEQCLDTLDPNCLVLASASFTPAAPLSFPTNFPDEFFYALAESDILSTPGCAGTSPGKASVRLALEAAFINGAPAAADRMVFGRIRIKVTSGLCPQTTYRFQHPFGTTTLTTNAAGAIPANVGTVDIGCVPATGVLCNFATATTSPVFGTAAAGGFLRWDPAVAPAAPAGYLGDGAATLHPVVGGTNGNSFTVQTAAGAPTGITTNLFTVAGKLAGPLVSTPDPFDFGGVRLGSASGKTVSVTNVDTAPVTIGTAALSSPEITITGGSCVNGKVLTRDQSCTYQLRFAPTGLAGRRAVTLTVPSTGGIRSPQVFHLTGSATNPGAAPVASLSSPTLAFGNVRVRTAAALQQLVITNTGTAPLGITDVSFDPVTNPEPDQYRILSDSCSTGAFVDPGQTCTVDVGFTPFLSGAHPTRLLITSNAGTGLDTVAVTGTGTGGAAAVSAEKQGNGFPEWYRDEAGVKVVPCLDQNDPNCVVLPDEFFDPARPVEFPTNFPGEFFYTVSTSDVVAIRDPACAATPGKALMRSAVEGTFVDAAPADGDQMVFGRVRFSVTGGLCPGTEYIFTSPYGADSYTTDTSGSLKRSAATDDVGCVPAPGAPCVFADAISSRVLGSFVRWDPAVAPAAPAGYIGDGATLHRITGAPYSPDGISPANYFQVTRASDGVPVGRTDLFAVSGKLRGPLEADRPSVTFSSVPVGSTSATEKVTYTNTGLAPISVTEVGLTGFDGADFAVTGDSCTGADLVPGATCDVSASFSPTATGDRSMTLAVRHTGLNSPLQVALGGVGGAQGTAAAISLAPRSLDFAPLHVGRTSPYQTVTVSNAGGTAPLTMTAPPSLAGPGAASFAIVHDRCDAPVAPGDSCEIDIAFDPQAAGALSASLVLQDNAPGLSHSLALTGRGSDAVPAVSPGLDPGNGFPQWYQDENGVRLEPCLDTTSGNCIVLGDATYDPAQALSFPDNFPGEFFYAVADSEPISTPGCAGTPAGLAFVRVALEGSFAGGDPVAGDQTTFGRVRIVVTSGLCPSTPYTFETPYGSVDVTTDGNGGFARNVGTTDVGCGAAPCAFGDTLASGPAQSFLRWSPADGVAPPAGYLGDGAAFHHVVGGTYTRPGDSSPLNEFVISDSAGNEIASSDRFLVSGKIAGPLQADTASIAFGHAPVGSTTGSTTVTVTSAALGQTPITGVTLTGANAADFTIVGGTCQGATLALDGTCTVDVAFSPRTSGVRTASLRAATNGQAVSVPLTGLGDAVPAPAIRVTPGVLAFGTVTAPNSSTLTTTIANTGDAPLSILGAGVTGGAASDYTALSACPAQVLPGGSCTIAVTFTPSSAGARTASLTITHNATGGQTVVSLTGTGAGSSFTLSPDPVKLGTVNRNTTKTATVTVKNTGTTGFRITSAAVQGAQSAFFTVTGANCLGSVLAAGRSCNLTVSFRPTAATAYTGTLVVTGDSTTLPASRSVQLTGTGK